MSQIKNFLRQGGSELIRKALTSATGSGEALIPQFLEKLITNTVIRLTPEFTFIKPQFGAQKLHEFNKITSLGTGYKSMGEVAVTPTVNSSYTRSNVTLKVTRSKGLVSDFEQEASANFVDALATEIEQQIRAQVYALNFLNMYGNSTANAYAYDGWDNYITTNRSNAGFSSGAPTVPTSLKPWDDMIDASNRRGGAMHDRAFIMSPEMTSLMSRLTTNIVRYQENGDMSYEVYGGWRLATYRGIPIVQSSYTSGAGASTMGTVTAASNGTGTLSDGTYYFQVSYLDDAGGESMASAQSSVTLSGGGSTQAIQLSFTAVPSAQFYKVYYSATTGLSAKVCIGIVAACAYDSAGTPGAATTTIQLANVSASAAAATYASDKPLTLKSGGANAETIWLIDFDTIQGLGKFPYTNNGTQGNGMISMRPLYNNDAGIPFLIYTHGAICPSYEATSALTRGYCVA